MKKVKLFSFALAALMLGACTNEDVIDNGGKPQWNSQGKGYINLSINLPTEPSTRANDVFDDGTPEEYKVNDATLILFGNNAIKGAYSLKLNFSPETPNDNNITTTAKITQKINEINADDIEALVVLNNNGVFTVDPDDADLKVGTESMLGKDLTYLNNAVNKVISNPKSPNDLHTTGFLMSNAPLATAPGNTNDPTTAVAKTLVKINSDNIKGTEAEAAMNPAANIYVERAVAKVTLTAENGETTSGNKKASYEILGWMLDNTNKTSKLVRTVDGFDTWKSYMSNGTSNHRFIGDARVGTDVTGTESYYRIYWGDDYNYGTTDPAQPSDYFTTIGGAAPTSGFLGANGTTPAYCFENTMDMTNMLEQNATRVIIAAKFNGGKDFYVIDGDKETYWTEDDLKAEIAARVLIDPNIYDWAKKNVEGTLTSSDLVITLTKEDAGIRTVESVGLADNVSVTGTTPFPADDAKKIANNTNIEFYAGGISYYSAWIKHFGNDLTPWNDNETDKPSVGNIYPGSDNNYLGRYSVLRNNWYDMTVTGIKTLGSPVVEEVTGETIDKLYSYISVEINVLSWAKRTQDVEL